MKIWPAANTFHIADTYAVLSSGHQLQQE